MFSSVVKLKIFGRGYAPLDTLLLVFFIFGHACTWRYQKAVQTIPCVLESKTAQFIVAAVVLLF